MVELPPAEERKRIYCPQCDRETWHKWMGYWRYYSQWECEICKRVILGPPYRAGIKPP